MRNRTTCPNCGTEVDGSTLGYGTDEIDDGEHVFGCLVCVTPIPVDHTPHRNAVLRAASHVLGVAFVRGDINTPAENFSGALGELAEAIADRAVKEGFSPGQRGQGKS